MDASGFLEAEKTSSHGEPISSSPCLWSCRSDETGGVRRSWEACTSSRCLFSFSFESNGFNTKRQFGWCMWSRRKGAKTRHAWFKIRVAIFLCVSAKLLWHAKLILRCGCALPAWYFLLIIWEKYANPTLNSYCLGSDRRNDSRLCTYARSIHLSIANTGLSGFALFIFLCFSLFISKNSLAYQADSPLRFCSSSLVCFVDHLRKVCRSEFELLVSGIRSP